MSKMSPETEKELDSIARLASIVLAAEGDSEPTLRLTYELLRERLAALNLKHGWSNCDDFAAMLPEPDGQQEISELEVLYGGRQMTVSAHGHVARLCGWVVGMRLANEDFS